VLQLPEDFDGRRSDDYAAAAVEYLRHWPSVRQLLAWFMFDSPVTLESGVGEGNFVALDGGGEVRTAFDYEHRERAPPDQAFPRTRLALQRWAEAAREASRDRASWAVVRKGIERGQELRVAAGMGVGASEGRARRDPKEVGSRAVAMMERMPARAMFVISELLDYPTDPRVSIC
jgi:hypothetical protein